MMADIVFHDFLSQEIIVNRLMMVWEEFFNGQCKQNLSRSCVHILRNLIPCKLNATVTAFNE